MPTKPPIRAAAGAAPEGHPVASGVKTVEVAAGDDGMRLDRWFRREYPGLTHGRLEKLLRTGQVRVGGKRAKASQRLASGQMLRIPPMGDVPPPQASRRSPTLSAKDETAIREMVLYRDEDVIALAKPPGLATQGGTGQSRHLDGMLDALRFEATERPRLVHRLDRDTSGVLLLARSAAAARTLAESFRGKTARKYYWALVAGMPEPRRGTIDLPLAKRAVGHKEAVAADPDEGKRAVTHFTTLETVGRKAAWLAFWPRTGRTHQLRVHAAAIGCPILGDGKYGGQAAFLPGAEIPKQLHLHARRLVLPHPSGRGMIDVTAPLPEHMRASWAYFGFDENEADPDPFAELD